MSLYSYSTVNAAVTFQSFSANYSSVSNAAASIAPTPRLPPPPSPSPAALRRVARRIVAAGSVIAGSLAALEAAVQDPTVQSITLTAHVTLSSPLLVANRQLSIEGGSCSAFGGAGTLSPGACALDTGGVMRHFVVRDGAQLALSGLALLNGVATQACQRPAPAAATSAILRRPRKAVPPTRAARRAPLCWR